MNDIVFGVSSASCLDSREEKRSAGMDTKKKRAPFGVVHLFVSIAVIHPLRPSSVSFSEPKPPDRAHLFLPPKPPYRHVIVATDNSTPKMLVLRQNNKSP